MRYLTDGQRHLVCIPYSIPNLHAMATQLGIHKCWFHRGSRGLAHYDIPKRRKSEIEAQCEMLDKRSIIRLIRNSNATSPA
jgi:hypothetical protein